MDHLNYAVSIGNSNARHSHSDGLTDRDLSDSQNLCDGKSLRPRSVIRSEREFLA
jgi:hypothetical protein